MPDEVNYETHLVEYEVAQSILSSAHLPIMCFAYQRWLETLRLTDAAKVERIISGINERNDARERAERRRHQEDRKSTRLNSSHSGESRMPSSA